MIESHVVLRNAGIAGFFDPKDLLNIATNVGLTKSLPEKAIAERWSDDRETST